MTCLSISISSSDCCSNGTTNEGRARFGGRWQPEATWPDDAVKLFFFNPSLMWRSFWLRELLKAVWNDNLMSDQTGVLKWSWCRSLNQHNMKIMARVLEDNGMCTYNSRTHKFSVYHTNFIQLCLFIECCPIVFIIVKRSAWSRFYRCMRYTNTRYYYYCRITFGKADINWTYPPSTTFHPATFKR